MIYRYRIFEADGSDAGEAHYAVPVKPSETILTGAPRKYRVLEVLPIAEDEDSPHVGLLRVEPA